MKNDYSRTFFQMEDGFRSTLEVPREVQNSKLVQKNDKPKWTGPVSGGVRVLCWLAALDSIIS